MKPRSRIKINLSDAEKRTLKRKKMRQSDILALAIAEIEIALEVSFARAREIHALAEFQTLPSVGIKFAEDLIFLGYYALSELKSQEGARLIEAFERKKGYWVDPCVEDQFRLVVDFVNHQDHTRKWWDFTEERKKYRLEHGYPPDRPRTPWYEVVGISRQSTSPEN
jgi:hypothetical protein